MKLIYGVILTFFSILPIQNTAYGKVEIFNSVGKQNSEWSPSNQPNNFVLQFKEISNLAGKKLIYKGSLNLPKAIKNVNSKNESTKIEIKNQILDVELLALEEILDIFYTDGTKAKIKIVTDEFQFKLFNDLCKKYLIHAKVQTVKPNEKIPAIPLGISCSKVDDKLVMTISLPSEADWMDSTIYESAGKGESWRFYELPSTARDDGQLGNIKINLKNVEFLIFLQNIRLNIKEEKPKPEALVQDKNFFDSYHFNVGNKSLSFDAGEVKSSSTAISLKLGARTKPIFSKIVLGLDYGTALVSAKDENNITYSELFPYVVYEIKKTKASVALLSFAKVSDFLHKSSQTRLQATLAGLAIDTKYKLTNHFFWFNYELGIFVAKGIKSQNKLELGYGYSLVKKSNFWLGLGFDNQEYKAVNTADEARTFKEGNILIRAFWQN